MESCLLEMIVKTSGFAGPSVIVISRLSITLENWHGLRLVASSKIRKSVMIPSTNSNRSATNLNSTIEMSMSRLSRP